jgi:glycosyltransferase involved in cell wall biosynthesis
MKNELPSVSIICLCYNGAKYLKNFYECILNQTYNNIKLIVIDDCSTDNSYYIMDNYNNKLKDKGFEYVIKRLKENQGPAGAYNAGLEEVNSDYVIQIDCDDTITPNTISSYVNYLEENKECEFVRSNGILHYIDSSIKDIEFIDLPNIDLEAQYDHDLSSQILSGKSYIAPPCSYFYRFSALKKIYPDLKIDSSRLGQNYQILLPLAYKYKGGFIKDVLFTYNIHNDSLEHKSIPKNEEIWRIDESVRLIRESLILVNAPISYIEQFTDLRENRFKLALAYKYKDKKLAKTTYHKLQNSGKANYEDKKNYISARFMILNAVRLVCKNIHIFLGKVINK